jgi:hypothetical protein
MDEFKRLEDLIQQVRDDVLKAMGGNKAAGTRVRKEMQEVKRLAQSIREKILLLRGDGEDSGDSSTDS